MVSIEKFMNPNRRYIETDCFLTAGTCLRDIQLKDIDTSAQYIGIKDNSGNIVGTINAERLRYVISYNQSTMLNQILDHLDIGIIAIDKDSRIFYVNPAYSEILNVSIGKIIGRYLNVVEKNASLLNILKTKKGEYCEKQLIESINKYVSTNMFPLFSNGEFIGACSMFTDVTELNDLTNEVVRISRVAEEYNRQIQAHDFLYKDRVIGESPIYKNCTLKAMMVAKTDATVLIRGENGVGKEAICKIIQQCSERAEKPFIKVNCAAIPEALIESELFGYEEGSFTGAKKGGRPGKFQLAEKGTLLLDEIGDLPLGVQSKLLRVLQEGEIEKIGGEGSIPVDVRVIASTNQPLEKMIEEGVFRMDLYYRLNVVTVDVPPLRSRGNDIILLANEFLNTFNIKYSKRKGLSQEVYKAFMNYPWPGNVRELRNTIESLVILSMEDVIGLENLSENISRSFSAPAGQQKPSLSLYQSEPSDPVIYKTLKDEVNSFEKKVIIETLNRFDGNRNKAMAALNLSRRTFYRKLSDYGIKNN